MELNSIHFCKSGIRKKQYKYIIAVSFGVEVAHVVKFDTLTGITHCDRTTIHSFLQDINTRGVFSLDSFFIIHKDYYKLSYNGEFNVRQPIIDLCKEVYREGRKKAIELIMANTLNVSGYNYSIVEDAPSKQIDFNNLRDEYKLLISKSIGLFDFEFNKNLVSKNLYS